MIEGLVTLGSTDACSLIGNWRFSARPPDAQTGTFTTQTHVSCWYSCLLLDALSATHSDSMVLEVQAVLMSPWPIDRGDRPKFQVRGCHSAPVTLHPSSTSGSLPTQRWQLFLFSLTQQVFIRKAVCVRCGQSWLADANGRASISAILNFRAQAPTYVRGQELTCQSCPMQLSRSVEAFGSVPAGNDHCEDWLAGLEYKLAFQTMHLRWKASPWGRGVHA